MSVELLKAALEENVIDFEEELKKIMSEKMEAVLEEIAEETEILESSKQ